MIALVRSDAPGYQTYRDYITIPGYEDWTEVIELATGSGLSVDQVKQILAGQLEIAKKVEGVVEVLCQCSTKVLYVRFSDSQLIILVTKRIIFGHPDYAHTTIFLQIVQKTESKIH